MARSSGGGRRGGRAEGGGRKGSGCEKMSRSTDVILCFALEGLSESGRWEVGLEEGGKEVEGRSRVKARIITCQSKKFQRQILGDFVDRS